MNTFMHTIIFSVLLATLTACGGGDSYDDQLSVIINSKKLTGDPTTGLTLPSISSAKAKLGMKLFFTKGLGGDSDSACVTCHHPKLGGGDNLSLPIGVNAVIPDLLGPGRLHSSVTGFNYDGSPTVPRNSPTTFNLAMWKKVLFHDGRVEALSGGGIRTPDSAFNTADPDAGSITFSSNIP